MTEGLLAAYRPCLGMPLHTFNNLKPRCAKTAKIPAASTFNLTQPVKYVTSHSPQFLCQGRILAAGCPESSRHYQAMAVPDPSSSGLQMESGAALEEANEALQCQLAELRAEEAALRDSDCETAAEAGGRAPEVAFAQCLIELSDHANLVLAAYEVSAPADGCMLKAHVFPFYAARMRHLKYIVYHVCLLVLLSAWTP